MEQSQGHTVSGCGEWQGVLSGMLYCLGIYENTVPLVLENRCHTEMEAEKK